MKLFICCLFLFSNYLEASWLERKAEGWAWYEDISEEKEDAEIALSAAEEISLVRKDLEEKLALAVLDPTPQNIENYVNEQKICVDRSSDFAREWMRFLLRNPQLDQTTMTPVSQYGNLAYKQMQHEKKISLMQDLVQTHGLFFFFNGRCRISQAFAKVVKAFSRQYHWKVVAVSLDGDHLEDFPDARIDNGIARELGVAQAPALFVVNPSENEVVPIAYGPLSADQIENNVLLQFQYLLEEAEDG